MSGLAYEHDWDMLRARPTERAGIHESVFQAYGMLEAVQEMLRRGDSAQTILDFISFVRWAQR